MLNGPNARTESFSFFHSLSPDKPLDVLLVEDVTSDALLIRLALNSAHVPYSMRTLRKGDEVLPWLTSELQADARGLPDVIMLDLGLPCQDGFEVLEEISRADPLLRAIPIIILTGYGDFEYISRNDNLCVQAYLTKPCSPKKLHDVLGRIRRSKAITAQSKN